MKDQTSNQPAWVTNVYQPEGSDRLGHNSPVRNATVEDEERPATVAEMVSMVNRRTSRNQNTFWGP